VHGLEGPDTLTGPDPRSLGKEDRAHLRRQVYPPEFFGELIRLTTLESSSFNPYRRINPRNTKIIYVQIGLKDVSLYINVHHIIGAKNEFFTFNTLCGKRVKGYFL